MSGLFTVLAPLERALDYHLERQNVLNGNVANVNTPGYKARDLVQPAQASEGKLALQTTNGQHLAAGGANDGAQMVEDTTSPAGLDGNTVTLEKEMSKMMANSLRYDAATEVISRRLAMLRYAASDGSGS